MLFRPISDLPILLPEEFPLVMTLDEKNYSFFKGVIVEETASHKITPYGIYSHINPLDFKTQRILIDYAVKPVTDDSKKEHVLLNIISCAIFNRTTADRELQLSIIDSIILQPDGLFHLTNEFIVFSLCKDFQSQKITQINN